MNTQNDERKVIPIESHPRWWAAKYGNPVVPSGVRAPHQRRKTPGVVYTPNPEPPTAA